MIGGRNFAGLLAVRQAVAKPKPRLGEERRHCALSTRSPMVWWWRYCSAPFR
jgi:hypothetical protein